MNRRKYNVLSTHLVKYHFLFDQPKRCKEELILKALQGWLRIPFLITPVAYTYCISSNNSAFVLSYQWFPTSIQCGEALARRRKEERRVGSPCRGMVRRL